MIENSVQASEEKNWDVIVVGAGTIGLFISFLLGEQEKKVLCLDSGGFSFDNQKQQLNDAIITGESHLGVSDARARIVGGTSTLWGGQLAKFTRTDFEDHSNSQYPTWPIDYEEMEPWYKKTATQLNINGYDIDHNKTLERIFGQQPLSTDSIEFYATYWLKTPNFAKFYNQKIKKHKNVSILPNAHVTALNTDSSGKIIENLTVFDKNQTQHNLKAKTVILCNGTLEISRLLLISADKNKNSAWSSNKNIGAYFQDHLDIECGKITANDPKIFSHFFENAIINSTKIQPKLRLTQQQIIKHDVLNIGGSINFQSSLTEDITYLKSLIKSLIQPGMGISGLSNFPNHISGLIKIWGPLAWRYIKNRRIMAFMDEGAFLRAHMEQRPIFDSKISLDYSQTDMFGMPKLNLHWQIDWETQMRTLQLFTHGVDTFMQEHKLGDLRIYKEIIDGDITYLQQNYRDSFHQCGGAIMSTSADNGVVDINCRVHDTENLYVAGAAVFPSSSYANPTFTALALASRLADHILL